MAIDFADLKEVVNREAVDLLDHRNINDIMENPTAEIMVVWIWNRLSGVLPGLVELQLHETRNCSVIYRGE
jgi:6-pyruvoyltetrahydropterin/6-carboxytetrahydropterin synthase